MRMSGDYRIAPAGGTAVAAVPGMADDSVQALSQPAEPVHQFTVRRGMLIVMVIETTSWYGGLLQAAVARIALEGQN
jgi:hypothetical protein